MFRLICIVLGYFIGSIQPAYFMGKILKNIDIRNHGSGNAGATNTLRVLGPKAGFMVFGFDVFKAIFVYILCSLMFDGSGSFINTSGSNILPGLYGGLGVMLGHSFPFYLKFKGGKGISSTLGVILSINLLLAIFVYSIGVILVILKKYISLGSLGITFFLPFFIYFFNFPIEAVFISFIIMCLSFYLHRQNIKRIIKGTENKFTLKKVKT